jgi:hypothetical protein
MRKLILTTAAVAAAIAGAFAAEPSGKTSNANLIKQIPAGYRLIKEIRGDLNGDGADDYVLIIKATDKKMFRQYYDFDTLLDYNRSGIMIFFKDGDDYRLALENRKCFEAEFEDDLHLTPALSVRIKKGNLYLAFGTGRAKHGWVEYTFRYRDSEFELIGYDESEPYNCTLVSINFLTKKQWTRRCILDEGETMCFYPCSDDKARETWNNITIKKSVTLREVVDFDRFDIDKYIIRNKH